MTGGALGEAVATTSLGRNHRFSIYWAGQALSVFGSAFAAVAYPLLVLEVTHSVAQMGLVTAVIGVCRVVAGLVAGPVVDRLNRRRVMLFCDFGRTLVYGLIPATWLFTPAVWLLYVSAGIGSALSMLFQVAHVTAVASLVSRPQLIQANSRLETTNSLSYILGPTVAGFAVGVVGAQNAIAIDAVSFLASATAVWVVRVAPTARTAGSEPYVVVPGQSWFGSFFDGVRFLWRHPTLRWLTVLLGAVTMLTIAADDILIYWMRHGLHTGSDVVGVVFGVASLGGLLAATTAAPLRRRYGFARCWFGSYGLVGMAVAAIGAARTPWLLALIGITFTFGTTLAGICSMSLRQEVAPDAVLGRVTAAFWTMTTALAPVGAALVTALSGRYGVPAVAVVAGALCLGIVGLGLVTPLAGRGPGPGARVVLDAGPRHD